MEPEAMFAHVKDECEFNFERSSLWEKRDSQKQIKKNQINLKLTPDYDNEIELKDSNEDEWHCNTKAWFSNQHFSEEEINESYDDNFFQIKPTLSVHANADNEQIEAVTLEVSPSDDQKMIDQPASKDSSTVDLIPVLQLSRSKEEESQSSDFEWNNFLVRRACFRGISVYFKSKFSKINTSWQRKRVNKKKKVHMHVLIKEFAIQEFGKPLIDKLSEEQWVQFRDTLYSLLFSHRYKKSDDFLEGVNFDLIRGVLYSYTTETRVELMSNPFFSLLILNFLRTGKDRFVQGKVKGKPQLYANELQTELDSLQEEAISFLKPYDFFDY